MLEVPVAIICFAGQVSQPRKHWRQTPLYYCGSHSCWYDLNATRRVLSNLLAVPMCLLFELGLLVARFYQPKEDEEETTDEESAVENQGDLNHKD